MLRHLHVANYALIRRLDTAFEPGLTVITGETGAGKSILLGALGLILGKRADSKVLFDADHKCVVEARFGLERYGLESFFEAHDLDYEPETIIRREVNRNGKSRAFINDTPVKLAVLTQLAARLVHIHSQHETLDLNRSRFQRGVLDALADHGAPLAAYRETFAAWKEAKETWLRRKAAHEKAVADRDYWQFQFDELENANLNGADSQAWEEELRALEHAEESKRVLLAASEALNGEDAVVTRLEQAASSLRSLLRWVPEAEALLARVESVRLESEDLAEELERLERQTAYDEERIGELQSALDAINRLLVKHRLPDAEALRALQADFEDKLLSVDTESGALDKLEKQVLDLEAQLKKQAAVLHEGRAAAAPAFEKAVAKLLKEVGMAHARLAVALEPLEKPGPEGMDQVRFTFASNKGSRFEDLRQVASGGELSRLMLCIKRLVAERSALPTLLFDEIDTGVGGEIGKKIGALMGELAGQHQVIAITHLPQIAACGDHHLFVYKDHEGATTSTHLRSLDGQERIDGIARMLSGDDPGAAALANAKELLAEGEA